MGITFYEALQIFADMYDEDQGIATDASIENEQRVAQVYYERSKE